MRFLLLIPFLFFLYCAASPVSGQFTQLPPANERNSQNVAAAESRFKGFRADSPRPVIRLKPMLIPIRRVDSMPPPPIPAQVPLTPTPSPGAVPTRPDGDWRGKTIIGISGQSRQVTEDGFIMADGVPMGDGNGNPLKVAFGSLIVAGGKRWGHILPNGQVVKTATNSNSVSSPAPAPTAVVVPPSASPIPSSTASMNFRGRTITGISGVQRQVDSQGRILIDNNGTFQQIDGENLIVQEDGIITLRSVAWGFLTSTGQVVKGAKPS